MLRSTRQVARLVSVRFYTSQAQPEWIRDCENPQEMTSYYANIRKGAAQESLETSGKQEPRKWGGQSESDKSN